MQPVPILIYDIEIANAIPSRDVPQEMDITYCEGWTDYAGMGISLITAWAYGHELPRVFFKDNIVGFFEMIEAAESIVTFNGEKFDNQLLRAVAGAEIPHEKHFDLYLAIKEASGQPPFGRGKYNLDALAQANFGVAKRQTELPPILFQRGKTGHLVEHGLLDIMLTKWLLELCAQQPILDPNPPHKRLHVALPPKIHDYLRALPPRR